MAARNPYGYNPYRHDEDSLGYNNSYTGPSERELMGGCNRCGGMDDCYCPDPEPEPMEGSLSPRYDLTVIINGKPFIERSQPLKSIVKTLQILGMVEPNKVESLEASMIKKALYRGEWIPVITRTYSYVRHA